MAATSSTEVHTKTESNYDRMSELKSFDETMAGVKGLVDAGITTVPRIFFQPPENSPNTGNAQSPFPTIDLRGIREDPIRRKEIVDRVRDASENWGLFQVVNHGIPGSFLEKMLDGVRAFHEQEDDEKKKWYTRDLGRRVVYNCNFDLFVSPATDWRDTFHCTVAPNPPKPEELPTICSEILMEYSKEVKELGCCLFELLSEALGLDPNHLRDIDCDKELTVVCHYYPECPQPELTLGTSKHTDVGFLTVLLQDHIGGLQILHQDRWVDVPPLPGALVVNIGDLLQLMSNDMFKSVEHRVLANLVGPRISVASLFNINVFPSSRLYGPIEKLLSKDNPPKYRATTGQNYTSHYNKKGLDGTSGLLHFKI